MTDEIMNKPIPRAEKTKPHYHMDEYGTLVKCYHACKSTFFSLGFWAGLTLGFPVEHWLWEKVWPFTLITEWLGL